MTGTVAMLNVILASSGIVLFIASIALLIDLLIFQRAYFGKLVNTYGLKAASILLILSSSIALLYSDIFGFVPCGLCWLMRIFTFSQAFIVTAAVFVKDKSVSFYGIILSIPGILIGLYHYYLQMGGSELVGCPSAGAECTKRIMFEYGFMTFPLLGVSVLSFLLLMYMYLYSNHKRT